TALSSNEGELARSITTCVPAMAGLRPSPVMLLTPVLGEAATTSWPRWRRMGTVFEPIRPVPPIMTIFIPNLLMRSPEAGFVMFVPRRRRNEPGAGCHGAHSRPGALTREEAGGRARDRFAAYEPPNIQRSSKSLATRRYSG